MRKLILWVGIFVSLHLQATLQFEGFNLTFKFDRQKYLYEMPPVVGGRGMLLFLKDKNISGEEFSISAGGHLFTEDDFKKLCEETYRDYKHLGGQLLAIKRESTKCSFRRILNKTYEQVTIVWDIKGKQYFSFVGVTNTRMRHLFSKKYNNLLYGLIFYHG